MYIDTVIRTSISLLLLWEHTSWNKISAGFLQFCKFIWNNGNDRVQRDTICNDFENCGLQMINPIAYAQAQKMYVSF